MRLSHLSGTLFVAAILAPSLAADPIVVTSSPLALSPREPARQDVGALTFRGCLLLASKDRRFGGFSAIRVTSDGRRFFAISDEGYWFTSGLEYDARGFLLRVVDAEIGPLLGFEGKPLSSKFERDAESLAVLPDGSRLVGFEHHHRIWHYPAGKNPFAGRPEPYPTPPDLERAPANLGLEALTTLNDGRLLALTEDMRDGATLWGWIGRDGVWSPLRYEWHDELRPSDAGTLASGDVLVLERSWSPKEGVVVRVRRVAIGSIVPGAVLDGRLIAELRAPLTLDNLEGLAIRQTDAGETLVYLISDDNYSPRQRTLLMMFALRDEASVRSSGPEPPDLVSPACPQREGPKGSK